MILTKDELFEILQAANAENNFLNIDVLFEDFLRLLEWEDEEARDINDSDLCEFEDLTASRLDTFLAELEEKLSSRLG